MTYFDLMYEVYITGDLARIEGYLQTLDPNMDNYTREDLLMEMKDVHPDFEAWEDEYGFGMHLDDGGTLIGLAALGERHHHSSEEIIKLLVQHGARVDHPSHVQRAIAWSDLKMLECLTQRGWTILPEHVVYAFQCGAVATLQWMHEKGVRVCRSDREIVSKQIQSREVWDEYDRMAIRTTQKSFQ